MRLTILGSGGCTGIPKPLCRCRVCREARLKGIPYARGGPAAFLHDANLLIDVPAEISAQLNRENIRRVDYLMLTHLDPDHVEGLRVVEQLTLDFRTWRAYPGKRITLLLPADRGPQVSFIYGYEKDGRRLVYAPCDIKPFPEQREEVWGADLLVIQPGIFETGLRHGFRYPPDHISRKTLYTFEQTQAMARRIGTKRTVFVHLEEYWHRGHDDYRRLEKERFGICFARDGLRLKV